VAQTDSAQAVVIDEVAWVVGDEAIFRSDVEEYIRSMLLMGEKVPSNALCLYAEELAMQKLYLHQAALDSIAISDDMLIQVVNQQ
jgi:peptidyl-prolyl cis-trans isomerase SurA